MSKQTSAAPVNKPIHTVRHRSIKATIWKNKTEKGFLYNVTITRSYKDGEQWRDTSSIGFDDLMNVAKLMSDAHSFISELRARETTQQSRPPQGARRSG